MKFSWLCGFLVIYGTIVSCAKTTASTPEPNSIGISTSTNTTTAAVTASSRIAVVNTTQKITNCSSPGLINGLVKLSNGTFIGSVATYMCNNGYYIIGSCEESVTSECLQSGKWNISTPICVSKGDGVSLTFSKNQFIEDSSEIITMTCISTIKINNVKDISIRREINNSWISIVTLSNTSTPLKNTSSDLAMKAAVHGAFRQNINLTLSVNESDLVCEDEGFYQCHVSYIKQHGQCYGEANEELKGFYFPKAIILEGSTNGVRIENSSLSDPAQVKVGDTLSLNCTAKLGNNPNVTISWLSANLNSILTGSLKGKYSKGTAIKDDDCQYKRSDTMNYTISATDLSAGNISYSCNVEVYTPDSHLKELTSDKVYVEIYEDCPRPSPIMNGNIVVSGTSNGSRAELKCDDGYVRSTGFSTCTSSGQWDVAMKCNKIEAVDCKNLTSPLHGRVIYTNNSTLFNNSAQIVCNNGYNLKGRSSSVCKANGQWSNINGTCVLKECQQPSPPDNGLISSDNNTFIVNDSVSFLCYPGYKLSGTAEITCTVDGTWTDEIPSCIIQNCSDPVTPKDGYVNNIASLSVNSTAKISCQEGYNLTGNGTIQCLENTTWSKSFAVCNLIECQLPSPPDNGLISIDNNTTFVNDSVSFSCYPGYKLTGTVETTCTVDGTWADQTPSCIIQNCTTPKAPSNGFYSSKTKLSVNSTASLICFTGYTLSGNGTIRCTVNGTWTPTLAICTEKDCNNLTSPSNGKVIYKNSTLFNNIAQIICNIDYKLEGHNSSVCQSNGQWSNTNSTCVLKECQLPPPPHNGLTISDNNTTYVNDSVSFSCYPGYNLTGTAKTTCTADGTWADQTPSCIIQNCTIPKAPSNGLYNVDANLSVNSTTSLSCKAGYKLSGNGTIKCTVDGIWTTTSAKCSAIECKLPISPDHGHGIFILGKLMVNDTVSYSCDPGYKLNGVNVTSCILNGTWADDTPTCIVKKCPSPLAPDNGHFVIDNGKMEVNDSVTFSCYPGYKLNGKANAICNPNGTWNDKPPTCTAKKCPSPLAPDNGQVDIDNGKIEVNDTVTFSCYPGYKLNGKTNTMCNQNGTWNDNPPTCNVQNCSNPSPPGNGNYRITTLQVNSTALLSCNQGYNLSGNGTIQCTENGTWTHTSVECLPLECSELQAPDNGSLVLSNYTFYESKGSFSCKTGYNLIGSNETECTLFGSWTNPKPSCRPVDCGNWINVSPNSCNVSYFPDSLYSSTAICSCQSGYHFNNSTKKSIAARCGLNGTWDKQSPPSCVAIECPPINVSQSIYVDYSDSGLKKSVDSTATFYCYNNESQIIGHEMVTCLTSGKWSGSSPKCEKIDKTVPPCQKEGIWNETLPGSIISKPCKEGYKGESSRKCTKEGKWKLPVDNCVRAAIAKLDNEAEAIKDNPSEQAVTNVLQNLDKLTNTTKSSESQSDITSGELEKVTSILETIVDISNKSAVTENQAESFLKTTSNLLNTDNAQSWQAISQKNDDSASDKQQSSGASKILDVVGRYSDAVVSLLKDSKNDSKTIEASNIVMHVAKVKTGTAVSFPNSEDKVKYKSSFHLPKESLKDLKHVSSVLYKNLTGILSSKTTSDGNETKHRINSEVVAVKIPNWIKNEDSFKLSLTFTNFQDKYSSLNCSFWKENKNAWDGNGCTLMSSSKSSTTCECNHLTNFAILMSPWVEENVDTKALDIISTVGCSISLIALVITIVFHIALWRYIKSDRVVILMNLSIALVISYAIFLGGVDRTENKDVCTSVAVLLQYIYLVVFFLMLAEGIEISVSVLYVFTTASRLKWLLPAAWLIPAVIVGISLGATQLEGYGNEQFCWLSVEGGLIWAFVAPAFIIIIVNFVLLVLVLRAAFGARTLAEKSKAERTKAGVKCLCVLLPVMGCTWVIGIFYVNKDMGWIQYVFAVCNGLQGLVIFLFHCALNKQIRMAIERRKRKYVSSLLSSASSTKKFTMPRVSTSSISDRRDSMSNSISRDDVSFKSRRDSEKRNFPEENYDMIDYKMMSTNSLHSSLMQKRL